MRVEQVQRHSRYGKMIGISLGLFAACAVLLVIGLKPAVQGGVEDNLSAASAVAKAVPPVLIAPIKAKKVKTAQVSKPIEDYKYHRRLPDPKSETAKERNLPPKTTMNPANIAMKATRDIVEPNKKKSPHQSEANNRKSTESYEQNIERAGDIPEVVLYSPPGETVNIAQAFGHRLLAISPSRNQILAEIDLNSYMPNQPGLLVNLSERGYSADLGGLTQSIIGRVRFMYTLALPDIRLAWGVTPDFNTVVNRRITEYARRQNISLQSVDYAEGRYVRRANGNWDVEIDRLITRRQILSENL